MAGDRPTSSSAPPTLASLRSRRVPAWYEDAKLGIFIHWSVASVPAFAPREHSITELLRTRYDDMQPLLPYSEWYQNSLRFDWSPVARHHRQTFGQRPYESFAPEFVAGLEHWDPDAWAERFAAAGARYVVMVTKHHDGFCLWPSRVENPRRAGWHTPRDCVGELARAVRARGMRFGVYYSGGLDWTFEPWPMRTMVDLAPAMPGGDYPAYAEAQVRELIDRVEPDVLWNDISWPTDRSRLLRLFADYYAAVPEGVVNDRWLTFPGWLRALLRIAPVRAVANALLRRSVQRPNADLTPPPSVHFDARTPEYAVFPEIRREKWECVRGMDKSFGYNRASLPEDFLGREELVHGLADIASKNGNLLLNVGPRGEDAGIPEPQLERLAWLGSWLARNGAALYGTRPWRRAEGATREGLPVRFTAKDGAVFAIVLGTPPAGAVHVEDLPAAPDARVELLGHGPLAWRREGRTLRVELPATLPDEPAHALSVSRVEA